MSEVPIEPDLFLWAYVDVVFKKMNIDIGDKNSKYRGKDNNDHYRIYNSICVPPADVNKQWWAYIPADDDPVWTKLDIDTYEKDSFDEVIFKLHNGSVYCGYINDRRARMSINPSRYVTIDCVDRWMEIPKFENPDMEINP